MGILWHRDFRLKIFVQLNRTQLHRKAQTKPRRCILSVFPHMDLFALRVGSYDHAFEDGGMGDFAPGGGSGACLACQRPSLESTFPRSLSTRA